MFKLAITALIASASASASADKAAMDKDAKNAEAGMAKYKVSPGSKIWSKNVKKVENFMASTGGDTVDFHKKTIEDLKDDCTRCVLSGNTYTPAKAEVKAVKADKAKKIAAVKEVPAVAAACASSDSKVKDTTAATIDLDLTYGEFMDGMALCPADYTATTVCMEEPLDLVDFKKGASTGKKGDKPYTWAYKWQGKAQPWDTCYYTAVMPSSFKGGLLLEHNFGAASDTQAVVRIVNSKSGSGYLYNSYTMVKLSVGKTNKVIVPFADSIDISMTSMGIDASVPDWSISFTRQTNEQIAAFTIEHGGVIVWVIIGIVVFCLLCVGVIVWKKCFHKTDDFYVEDCYARV